MNPATKTARMAHAGDLLPHLRRARLLDEAQLRRLSAGWPADLPAADAVARLVEAGLLTAFQGDEALCGRARRLRLGPYRLLEPLGAGGGGKVYKAEHVLMRRLVTVKVFGRRKAGPSANDPGEEVQVVSGLSHPNLAAALHATRLRGRLVLALEFVDGVDLRELLGQAGPLPVDLACEVARQAARALRYLHGRGLLHRDVKPANLLLAYEGARPVVKLIDLGLARPAGVEPELCGTFDYLAPERGLGEPIDGRSDLYSLGCTLYHLLCGQVPHPGGNWAGKLVRHRMDDPVPLPALRPDVPEYLAAVVARLMARAPEDRFPDAAALLAALDAPPASLPVAVPVPARRPSPGPLLRVLAAVLLGACAGGAARLAAPETTAASRRAPEKNVILVSGQDGEFIELQRAIDAAPDGGVVTLAGPGPYVTAPLACKGKRLTIRSADGVRARVERAAGSSEWDALIHGEGELRLSGLELIGRAEVAPVVCVEGGRLELAGCALRSRTPGPLLALRRGRSLRLRDTRLAAPSQAIAVEVGEGKTEAVLSGCEVKVRDVAGAAVLLWSPELGGGSATVALDRCEIEAGRVIALRGLGGRAGVSASSCRLTFTQALASVDACRDRADWRGHLSWVGRDNTHSTIGPYLRHDGRPLAWDEAAWARLLAGR